MYVEHLRELEDGNLEPLTNCGQYTCGHIRLNRQDLLSWRQLRSQVARDLIKLGATKERLEELLRLAIDLTKKSKILEEIATIESLASRGREQFGL
jgi:hypothetical protein